MKRNSFGVKKMIRAAVLSLGILTAAGFTAAPADIVCVAEAASSVSLNKTSVTLAPKKSTTLKLKGAKKKVTWKSSKSAVASVSSNGKVTAKKAGKATITAKSNGKTYKCVVTVKASSKKRVSSKAETTLSSKNVYSAMMSMKASYPEGKTYTNANYYAWKGGIYAGGYGCAGFAFMLSDEAFGTLSARVVRTFDDIRVGDIIRMNNDTHTVIVLKVKSTGVVVAEGNYNSSVHWGRFIPYSDINATGTYLMTRYPQ